MEQSPDLRWKQRFQNFEKSLKLLEQALEIKEPDIIQKAGIIQFFEMSFELAWNLLKDYLTEQGFVEIKSPRDAIKKSFEINLIQNGQFWLEMIEDRNRTAHTYDEEKANEMETVIRQKYFPLFRQLYESLGDK